MKASFFYDKENIQLEEIKKPRIFQNEILVKVKAVGVCPTDVKAYYYGSNSIKAPKIMGHEVSGIIVETKSKKFKIGDRVNIAADNPCMVCDRCIRGLHNLCRNIISLGVNIDGGYSEYMKVPPEYIDNNMVIKLADNISFIEGTFIEPVAVSLNALSLAHPQNIKKAIIIGDGPNAMIHLQLLKRYYNVHEVYITGMISTRLELARKLGVDGAINIENEPAILMNIKDNIDLVDITIGNGKALGQALSVMDAGTSLVIFGGSIQDSDIKVSMNKIHYNQITITGSTGTSLPHYIEAAKIVNSGILDLKSIISKTFTINQMEEAFRYSRNLEGIKGAIIFD